MAVSYGKDVRIYVDDTEIGGEEESSLTITGEPIDAYGKQDFPVKKKLPGWVDWSADATMLLDTSDSGYLALLAASLAATLVVIKVDVDGTELSGDAQISNLQVTGEKGAAAKCTFTATGLDALAPAS
jgi:hypothetical protein